MRLSAIALTAALLVASPALAQVEIQPLAAPDYFSLGSDNGLPSDLWRGTSPALAREVIPRIGTRPLSPAAEAMAVRVLATGANGPEDAGREPEVAAARVQALLALGRPFEAWAAVSRAPNLPTNPALSKAAAEAALIVGEDDRACRIAEDLSVERGDLYWLRLRAYCQARAGDTSTAQLTLTLASERQRDPTLSRLVGALIAGAGDPGAASLRDGLDLALSRRLALDLSAAKPGSRAVAAALGLETPIEVPAGPAARFTSPQGRAAELAALLEQAAAAEAKARPRLQSAVLIAVALGAEPTADQRTTIGDFAVPGGSVSEARLTAMALAAKAGARGEVALQILAMSQDAGGKPLKPADAARVVAALKAVGMMDEATAFADEAFAALQAP